MDTMQIVNQLDGLHKKYRQAMYLFAAPVVLLVIAYIGAPGMGAMAGTVVAVLMFAVPVGTIYASGRMSKINKEYQMIYKNALCCFNIEQDILGCSGELGVRIYETECRADGTVEAWKSF